MDRREFEDRLKEVGRQVVLFARQYVQQILPDEVAFLVLPNRSYDGNPLVGDEEVFPGDSLPGERHHGPWSVAEVVAFLWRDRKVPEWIDASVKAEDGNRTLVELRCCGRFTASDELLYHRRPGGVQPFSVKSPNLPPGWEGVEKSERFDLYWSLKPA